MNPEPNFDLIVQALCDTRKYGSLCPATLQRVARHCALRSHGTADAVKRAKRKLHQICGAFLPVAESRLATRLARSIGPAPHGAEIEQVCRRILDLHASTRERGAELAAIYQFALPQPDRVRRILDLGCGLHPFSRPFMGLARECEYFALDIDARLLHLVGEFFARTGVPGSTRCADLQDAPELPRVDVAFLWKLFPTLEQQEDGAAFRLLERLPAAVAVVSFPTASLGRREKGQDAHYRGWMEPRLAARGLAFRSFATRNELFYRMELTRASPQPNKG